MTADPINLAALRAEHWHYPNVAGVEWCTGCDHRWPCPTVVLADTYEEACEALDAVCRAPLMKAGPIADAALASLDAKVQREGT